MEVSFKKKFVKDLNALPLKQKEAIKKIVYEDIPNASSIQEISNVSSIAGAQGFYRIRKGDYRIGFKQTDSKVTFYRVLHRSEIYRKFP